MRSGPPGTSPFTVVRVLATGGTIPSVERQRALLLVQNNEVRVCRLAEDPDFGLSMEHPRNERELNVQAHQAVEMNCPHYLRSSDAIVLICPDLIAEAAEWEG
jgi:hypothetical protein